MLPAWRSSSLLIVLGAACGAPAVVGGESGGSTGSSSGAGDPIESPPDAGVIEDEPPSRGGGLFLQEPDGGVVECSTWSQDCPAGEKCTVWANDGGSSWNSTRCAPVDPDPDGVDEPCTVVDSGVSGIDSCVRGAMCWNVDPETNVGVCVEFCGGSEANPVCANPTYHCVGREPVLCVPTCCPLEQSCGEWEACYPAVDSFVCAPDVSGEDYGAFGDGCEYLNVCDAGLFCAAPDRVPDCEGSAGCCTAFCEVGSSTCQELHPDLECIAWFEEGQSPLESHVGGCMIPE